MWCRRVYFSVFLIDDMEVSMSTSAPLEIFVERLKKVPDPRSKRGKSHPFATVLALVLLGLLANISTLAEIQRWSELHLNQLQQFLQFRTRKKRKQVPHAITLARVLRKLSLQDLQNAFAEFLNAILQDTPLVAAVDGKTAKQMKDELNYEL